MKNPIYQVTLTKVMVNEEGLSDPLVAVLNHTKNGSTDLYDLRFWTEEDKLEFCRKWILHNLVVSRSSNPKHRGVVYFSKECVLVFNSESEKTMWMMQNL